MGSKAVADRAERLDVVDLQIEHARELVGFERSRADSADSQAVATGSLAVAAAAIASAADIHVNVAVLIAAAALVVAALSAVVARARYPPALTGERGPEAKQMNAVRTAEAELQRTFSHEPDALAARKQLVCVWAAMTKREAVRAHRKNDWLTLALYALLVEVLSGALGVAIA